MPSANNFKPTAFGPVSSFVGKSTSRLITVAKTTAIAENVTQTPVRKVPVVGGIDSVPVTILSECEYRMDNDGGSNSSPTAEAFVDLSILQYYV